MKINWNRLLRVALTSGALLTSLMFFNTTAASASCLGSSPQTKNWVVGGLTYARDTPRSGTCDGDTIYRFDFLDGPTSGFGCSYIDFSEDAVNIEISRFTCTSVSNTFFDDNDTNGIWERFRGTTGQTSSWYSSYGY